MFTPRSRSQIRHFESGVCRRHWAHGPLHGRHQFLAGKKFYHLSGDWRDYFIARPFCSASRLSRHLLRSNNQSGSIRRLLQRAYNLRRGQCSQGLLVLTILKLKLYISALTALRNSLSPPLPYKLIRLHSIACFELEISATAYESGAVR